MNKLKNEFRNLVLIIKSLDKKTAVVLISVPILLTISRYYVTGIFFKYGSAGYGSSGSADFYKYTFWLLADFITLFLLPWLTIRFIFKDNLNAYGIKAGEVKTGIKLSVLFVAIMIPVVWIITTTEGFILTYPMMAEARGSWTVFFIFESGILIYIFAWEFFFRGFMLFGLKDKFGYYAVFIQMIPFVLMHYGKPPAESFGAILGGLVLGILAYRTRSIYYCIITHAGIMFSIDLLSVLRYRANDFGLGFDSLLHIVKQII